MDETENPKTCLHCGKPLKGRADKKYCDPSCKSAYSNARRQHREEAVLQINHILKKNWKILKRLNPEGKSTVRKSFLHSLGYNFTYFTNVYKTQKGNLYYFCYDMGITEVDKTHICIVNWQSYMNSYAPPIAKNPGEN